MSKANNPIKVLRTALKRVQKGWTKNNWYFHDGHGNSYVCLEGAVYGYCERNKHGVTMAQDAAIRVLEDIIEERYGIKSIPEFNDRGTTTQDEVIEVIKLGIIRLETDAIMDDEDFENLLDFKERSS